MKVTAILLFYYFLPVLLSGLAYVVARKRLRLVVGIYLAIVTVGLAGSLWLFWPPDEFSVVSLYLAALFTLGGSVGLLVAAVVQRLMNKGRPQ